MLISLFGKEYGLLSTYSSNIGTLNFLVNYYILASFFNVAIDKIFVSFSL